MELRDALSQISDIRLQMARTSVFRGYRPVTVGFSGVLGLCASALQPYFVAHPELELGRFVLLWCTVASLSLIVIGVELAWSMRRTGAGLCRETTMIAVEQFLPCLVVGGLLTACIVRSSPEVAWMLPGLWSLLFGLGVFSSVRSLPRPVIWSGLYYVMCGCGCLLWGRGENTLAAWQMAMSFGGGQLLSAAILYWSLERSNVR